MAILTGTVSFPLAPVPLVLSLEELVHPAITKLAIMARVSNNKRNLFITVSSECYDFVYTTHLCPIERSIFFSSFFQFICLFITFIHGRYTKRSIYIRGCSSNCDH